MKSVAHSIIKFLTEVRYELSRIEWPSSNEFIGSTLVVLIIVSAFALYLGLVDRAVFALMQRIFAYSTA